MPEVVATFQLTVDGANEFPPLIERLVTSNAVQFSVQIQPTGGTVTYVALPSLIQNPLQIIALRSDAALNIKVNGSATPIPLFANCMMVLFNANIIVGAATAILINNPDAAVVANLIGLTAGQ